jgi:hypothetical protein
MYRARNTIQFEQVCANISTMLVFDVRMARGQEREDVVTARRAWIEALPAIDMEKLLFIDENWTSTDRIWRCGRAPRGQRSRTSAPYNH